MKQKILILLFFFFSFSSLAIEQNRLDDIVIGKDSAKIKIYTYQSLTCPHCAAFHVKIIPLLKKEYVERGTVQIYLKHFPLDLAALNAAKIVQCVNKKERINFLDYLYENQKIWIKGENIEEINKNLKNSVKQFGLKANEFEECLKYEDVEDIILNSRIEAVKNFKIRSTPTVVINNKVFEDVLEYENIKKTIEKLL